MKLGLDSLVLLTVGILIEDAGFNLGSQLLGGSPFLEPDE
jgi:hypothetical protein